MHRIGRLISSNVSRNSRYDVPKYNDYELINKNTNPNIFSIHVIIK